jgi:hypothetical protein
MADDPRSTIAPVALVLKDGRRLILPVDRFRAILREQYPERPALADEIDSPEWFTKRQWDPPTEGTTELKEYLAAGKAMDTFYQRVKTYEERLRGIAEDDVERDLGPIEQANVVEFNIWTRRFDGRTKDFSKNAPVLDVGHVYRDVWCYVDLEPSPPAAQPAAQPVSEPVASLESPAARAAAEPELSPEPESPEPAPSSALKKRSRRKTVYQSPQSKRAGTVLDRIFKGRDYPAKTEIAWVDLWTQFCEEYERYKKDNPSELPRPSERTIRRQLGWEEGEEEED